jgi:rhodanese-related sulfurtransferase
VPDQTPRARHPSRQAGTQHENILKIPESITMKTAHDLVTAAKARVQETPLENADQAIRDADILIDVRETEEYASGHIPGAVHISRGMLEFKLSNMPELASRDLKIVVYCKTSGRAALAACALADMGYLDVKSISGGFDAWAAAGKPVVKPELPSFE